MESRMADQDPIDYLMINSKLFSNLWTCAQFRNAFLEKLGYLKDLLSGENVAEYIEKYRDMFGSGHPMRYIDHINCKSAFERGESREIKSMGKLTRTATKIAEANGLGVLRNRQGAYRIIKACGLGAYEDFLSSLAEVDDFFKHLDAHKSTKY